MDPQTIIARRVAKELRPGNLVNLGIGIPTLVANYVPEGLNVFFQSENGLIGTGPLPEQGMTHPLLTDAGGKAISALPGAATFDSAMSFGLIRGGHVDLTVRQHRRSRGDYRRRSRHSRYRSRNEDLTRSPKCGSSATSMTSKRPSGPRSALATGSRCPRIASRSSRKLPATSSGSISIR